MNTRRWIPLSCYIFAFLFFQINTNQAQEQIGLRVENYAGIYGTILNPASPSTTPYNWDFNIGSAGFYFDNNIGFVRNQSLFSLLRGLANGTPVNHTIDRDPNELPSGNILADLYNNSDKKYGSVLGYIMGPSFLVKLRGGHTIGVTTTIRTAASGLKMSNLVDYYRYSQQFNNRFIKVSPIDIAGMGWSELGLNYSYRTETNNGSISLGFSVKYLNGYEGAFAETPNTFTFKYSFNDTIQFNNTIINFGYSDTNLEFQEISSPNVSTNGTGVGFDLGAVMTIGAYDSPSEYDWKLSLSIIDIGNIRFDHRAQLHRIVPNQNNTSSLISFPYRDYINYEDFNDIIQHFSELTLGDPNASRIGEQFTIGLPTALVFQADYSPIYNVFINTLLVQRLKINPKTIGRNNILAITPRYESKWFTVSMPLVVQNYNQVRLGLAARLAFLTIGTDYLGSIFKNERLRGGDFYIGLKVNALRFKEARSRSRGRGRSAKCYQF